MAHLVDCANREAIILRNNNFNHKIPVPFTLDKNLSIDSYSTSILDNSAFPGMVPLKTTGDGNCLFNAISTALIHNESIAMELRVRCCLEMITNKQFYVSHPLANSLECVSPEYDISCIDCATPYRWSSAWTILALTKVIQRPILSVYPVCNGVHDKVPQILSRLFSCGGNYSTDAIIIIMWTRIGEHNGKTWLPNHFVPLIKQQVLCGHTTPISKMEERKNEYEQKEDSSGERKNEFGEKEDSLEVPKNKFGEKEDSLEVPKNDFGEKEDSFGERKNEFGEKEDSFGERKNEFGDKGDSFGERKNEFGDKGDSFGERQNEYEQKEDSLEVRKNEYEKKEYSFGERKNEFGDKGDSFGERQNEYEQKEDSLEVRKNEYEKKEYSFGERKNEFGEKEHSFGERQNEYEQKEDSLEVRKNEYEKKEYSFGERKNEFGENEDSFGERQNEFGERRATDECDDPVRKCDREVENVDEGSGDVLPFNEFLPTRQLYGHVTNEFSTVIPCVPSGKKENVFFHVSNEINLNRRAAGLNNVFHDDCGAWTKTRRYVSYHLFPDFRQVYLYQGKYCNRKTKPISFYTIIDPQPQQNQIIKFGRYTAQLKHDPNYKKKVSWIIDSNHTKYIVEYLGKFPGYASHGNSRRSSQNYIRTDFETTQRHTAHTAAHCGTLRTLRTLRTLTI
ncbi:uncharacterized protein LOC108950575 [Ciona intestinalis]